MTDGWNELVSFAKDILALSALIGILIVPGQWIYKKISFDDVAGVALPVCERYVFGSTGSHEHRLLGARVFALETMSNVKVQFSGVDSVIDWGIHSDGIRHSSMEEFESELPRGAIPRRYLTSPLPDLPAGSMTTLMMIGSMANGENCSDSTVEVSSRSGKVYHGRSSFTTVREIPMLFLSPAQLVVIVYLIPLTLVSAIAIIRRKRRTSR